MKIKCTAHFYERAEQRFKSRDADYVINTFEYVIKKLVKKNKIFPELGSQPGTYVIRYKEFKFVYSKHDGEYRIITFARRNADSNPRSEIMERNKKIFNSLLSSSCNQTKKEL